MTGRTDRAGQLMSLPALDAGRGLLSRRASRSVLEKGAAYVLASGLGLIFMGPFLFALSGSLMTPAELYVIPPKWVPSTPMWENYDKVWTMVPFARYAANTLVITFLAMTGQIVSSCLVAYGFARFA